MAGNLPQSSDNTNMDAVREASSSFFSSFSDQGQKAVKKLFNKMDKDGDGQVSMQEFSKYMAKGGIKDAEICSKLFTLIDSDGNGCIDIEEAKLLYYTIMSRPVCDNCKSLVTGIYYTCIRCFKKRKTYDLCPVCYKAKTYQHKHGEFLDNYVLLRKVNTGEYDSSDSVDKFIEGVVSGVAQQMCCIM